MKIVVMLRIDEAQKNGKVVKWLKRQGDEVKENELVAEAMSEKITFDIWAPASGKLYRIFVEEEIEVPVGKAIALIAEPDDDLTILNKTVKELEI